MNVKVIGHRGLRQHAEIDENAARAVETGLKAADGIETDAVVSKDGTVFLAHDVTQKLLSPSVYVFNDLLDKASAAIVGNRRIEHLTDKEIEKLRLKNGGTVGRLSEVFNLAAQHLGKTINIEVKGEKALGPVIAEINKAVAAGQVTKDQIILTSFNHPVIVKAKDLAPDIKRGLIFSGPSSVDARIFPWSGNAESRYVEFNETALKAKQTRDVAADFFILRAVDVTAQNVSLLRKHFPAAKVMFWTSQETPPDEKSLAFKILTDPRTAPAIEAVISDYPEQMVKLLKAKGLHT